MKKEFKVEVIKEGALGTILFGSSRLPISKMEAVMNKYGKEGVVTNNSPNVNNYKTLISYPS